MHADRIQVLLIYTENNGVHELILYRYTRKMYTKRNKAKNKTT